MSATKVPIVKVTLWFERSAFVIPSDQKEIGTPLFVEIMPTRVDSAQERLRPGLLRDNGVVLLR